MLHVAVMLGGALDNTKRRARTKKQMISLVENLMGVAPAKGKK